MSEVMRVRVVTGLLWALVALAAVGGLVGWLRPSPEAVPSPPAPVDDAVAEMAMVASFGERFVTAVLGAESGGELIGFLGYEPDLPEVDEANSGDLPEVGPVRAAGVEPVAEGYWSVTTVDDLGQFWQVGVVNDGGSVAATGLPTPVSGPPDPERPDVLRLSNVPAENDALVTTVHGFIEAHACGGEQLERWLAPDASITPIDPVVCNAVVLDRWGVVDGEDSGRQVVVVEALLEGDEQTRRVTYPLALAERDGRWEVAELLPAAPRQQDSGGDGP